jgi:hypothetical protein
MAPTLTLTPAGKRPLADEGPGRGDVPAVVVVLASSAGAVAAVEGRVVEGRGTLVSAGAYGATVTEVSRCLGLRDEVTRVTR